jgi:hypothetical protein
MHSEQDKSHVHLFFISHENAYAQKMFRFSHFFEFEHDFQINYQCFDRVLSIRSKCEDEIVHTKEHDYFAFVDEQTRFI